MKKLFVISGGTILFLIAFKKKENGYNVQITFKQYTPINYLILML